MITITSKDNQRIKDLIKLRDDSKFRSDKSLFYVEGERIIKDTPKEQIESVYIESDKYDNFKYFLKEIDKDKIFILDSDIFNKVKDTINSQGIIATVKKANDIKVIGDFILVLDDINDPGNMGTIIRTCEATGVDTLIVSNGSCDIYNPKVIRASMSSIFRINIFISNNLLFTINDLKKNGYKIYTTALKNSINYKKVSYTNKICIVIGNEANGVNDDILNISDYSIKIPMKGKIESLNASIAASIMCYEAFSNRDEI